MTTSGRFFPSYRLKTEKMAFFHMKLSVCLYTRVLTYLHVVQIEDGYTKEALLAEEREKDLRTRLSIAEENALTSSSAVETAK